jgi:hypothetical protein
LATEIATPRQVGARNDTEGYYSMLQTYKGTNNRLADNDESFMTLSIASKSEGNRLRIMLFETGSSGAHVSRLMLQLRQLLLLLLELYGDYFASGFK